MNIRLIGLGDVGQRVAADCVTYFTRHHIGGLLESQWVLKLTTEAFADTYASCCATAQHELRLPERRRALRRALNYIFFQGPSAHIAQRLAHVTDQLTGAPGAPGAPALPAAEPHQAFLRQLSERVRSADRWDAFMAQLAQGAEGHIVAMNDLASVFGEDRLITPPLPLSEKQFRSRYAGLGRQVMRRLLRSQPRMDRLTERLGLVSCPVDVVAIAFSAGDSFGCAGADELARAIRETLQELNHNRIVALVGLALYEEDTPRALDGRCVGEYLRLNRDNNAFDGLIARGRSESANGGFGPLLATVAMASDRRVIMFNNPDANQLQRDFGKSLVSAGHSQAVNPGGQPVQPRLLALYADAMADLRRNHCCGQPFPLLEAIREESEALQKQNPGWLPPAWVGPLLAAGDEQTRGTVERMTARKVVAFVGYTEAMHGAQINALRAALLHDFPRARSVIYKYRVGDARLFAAPEHPMAVQADGTPVPPAAAPAGLQPHLALFVVDSLETRALERYWEYLVNCILIRRRPGGAVLDPDRGQHAQAFDRWKRLIARSLLSLPSIEDAWAPPYEDSGRTRLRHGVPDTIIGDVDHDFFRELGDAVRALVEGEGESHTLRQEVVQVYETVNTEQYSLTQRTRQRRLTADDVTDVLAGLNWLTNENLERRRVAKPLWTL